MTAADDDRRRRNWIPRLADRVRRLIEMAGEGEPAPSQEELEKIIQGYVPEGAEGGGA